MAGQGTDQGRGSRVAGRGYQQLRVWQKAHALALGCFKACDALRPWLAGQLSRSAISVAANVAEGYNRASLREYLQFLNIARGSLAETEYYLLFARDAGLLTAGTLDELDVLADDAGNLLLGLIRSLQTKDGTRPARAVRGEAAATRDPRPATRAAEPRP